MGKIVRDVLFHSLHFKTEPWVFYIADLTEAEDMGLILVKIAPGPILRIFSGMNKDRIQAD